MALIPKKNSIDYRPIMVINAPLRLLENALLQKVSRVKFDNLECVIGFRSQMSTHSLEDCF